MARGTGPRVRCGALPNRLRPAAVVLLGKGSCIRVDVMKRRIRHPLPRAGHGALPLRKLGLGRCTRNTHTWL